MKTNMSCMTDTFNDNVKGQGFGTSGNAPIVN